MELTTLNIKLNPLKDGAMTEGKPAYILFNNANTKAELFLPNEDQGMVLNKTNEGNWTNSSYTLISWKGYVLQKDGLAIFGGQ
ncbi:MAG TPA: hypothetical protein ENH87_21245 [Pricia antarctica]|uniref:Uncharacterized protein n=1 Tax=Pricia antarctica TaxID=641691 RepID=A0A831VT15_9FLAO|nr:hypothetical protein [Pricia antarctica]